MDNLQVGDRVWSLSRDGKHIVDDELVLMLHSERNTSGVYNFKCRINLRN
jgi:hypothetical protein